MKLHLNASIVYLSLIVIIQLTVGCTQLEKPTLLEWLDGEADYKPYEKTSLGRKVLSVSINGNTVTQTRYYGASRKISFIKNGPKYWVTPLSYAAFEVDGDNIQLRAVLESNNYFDLRLSMPIEDIVEGVEYSPEASLSYVYLPRIWITETQQNELGEEIKQRRIRPAVYRKATITESRIKIDTYYPLGDNTGVRPYRAVLSGEFFIAGHYTDSLGRVVSFKTENGQFDVSDNLVLCQDFNGCLPPNYWGEYANVIIEDND